MSWINEGYPGVENMDHTWREDRFQDFFSEPRPLRQKIVVGVALIAAGYFLLKGAGKLRDKVFKGKESAPISPSPQKSK